MKKKMVIEKAKEKSGGIERRERGQVRWVFELGGAWFEFKTRVRHFFLQILK
jgi:hypothetical protein